MLGHCGGDECVANRRRDLGHQCRQPDRQERTDLAPMTGSRRHGDKIVDSQQRVEADADQGKARDHRGDRRAVDAQIEAEDEHRIQHRCQRAGAKRHIHGPLGVAHGAQQGDRHMPVPRTGSDGNTICMNSVASSAVCPLAPIITTISPRNGIGERRPSLVMMIDHVEE
jgi:hypothetical protein